jgi:DNA-binding response OmpR family regulator
MLRVGQSRSKTNHGKIGIPVPFSSALPVFTVNLHGGLQPLTTKPSVLIVDRSEESREVLRTALERRGMEIFEAGQADRGLQLARQYHPNVIVLDHELESDSTVELFDQFAEQTADEQAIVVLGPARVPHNTARQFVAKPYHYGPLIRRIEGLIN